MLSLFGVISHMLYIDPAATSMLLTSITGIIVACGAGFFIIWRKIKKKVSKVLHIDENKNKEVEGELVLNEDNKNQQQTEENTKQQTEENKEQNKQENANATKPVKDTKDTNNKKDKKRQTIK